MRRAPFAIASDGEIYLSVFEMDGVDSVEDVVAVLKSKKKVFVGIALTPAERRQLREHLEGVLFEPAAFIAGRRRWAPAKKKKKKKKKRRAR